MSRGINSTFKFMTMTGPGPVNALFSDTLALCQQVYGGVSVGDFEVRWQHWQSECERRLEEGHFAGSHHLRVVCKVAIKIFKRV